MKRPPVGRRHLDVRTILDYLEDRIESNARRDVEEHLAGSCSRCRELLHEVGRLSSAMRSDRTPPVPSAIRERALEVFGVRAQTRTAPGLAWQVARLVFDSLVDPIPQAARRAIGDARWLRFAIDSDVLELEVEHETDHSMTIRGCVLASDPALHRIEVASGDDSWIAMADAEGRFSLEQVSTGEASITVHGPARLWRLPPLQL